MLPPRMAKLKHSTKGLVSFEEEVAAMEEGEEVEENQAENENEIRTGVGVEGQRKHQLTQARCFSRVTCRHICR